MIIKVLNTSPKTTFMTCNGNRTPKEIWKDTITGTTGMTKKSVIKHNDRLDRLGITPDMTEKEVKKQARLYLETLSSKI